MLSLLVQIIFLIGLAVNLLARDASLKSLSGVVAAVAAIAWAILILVGL